MTIDDSSTGSTSPATVFRLDYDGFLAARAEWDALNVASSSPSPFVSHAWLAHWWRHFGNGMEFRALVASRGDRWVAALPIAVRRQRGFGLPLRIAEIVGTSPVPTRGMGLADRADALTSGDDPAAVMALAGELEALLAEVDVVDLKGCSAASGTPELVAGASSGSAVCLPRSRSPFLELPSTWDEYLAGRSGNFRRQLRKFRRNLEREGPVRLLRLEADDDPAPWIDAIVAINGESWKAARGTNLLRDLAIRSFVGDLITELGPLGGIDLHQIRVGDLPVAYELSFVVGPRLFSYNSGFRDEFARLAPGYVLTAAVIEAGIGRGCTEYDLLRGVEDYKLRWTQTIRDQVELIVPGRTLRGWALAKGLRLKHWVKSSQKASEAVDRTAGWLRRQTP